MQSDEGEDCQELPNWRCSRRRENLGGAAPLRCATFYRSGAAELGRYTDWESRERIEATLA